MSEDRATSQTPREAAIEAKRPLANMITLNSAGWWDNPRDFYPAYLTADELEKIIPKSTQNGLREQGLWPPPPQGLTLLSSGLIVEGDQRLQDYLAL